MDEKELRELYHKLDTPDMKEEIFMKIHNEKRARPKLRLRAVVVIAVIALMIVGVGAAAGGVKLADGVLRYFRDADGNIVNPEGYHLEEGANAPLSEKALANIAPYVDEPGSMNYYFADTREELEGFVDMPLLIPDAVEEATAQYRLMATGVPGGDAVTISVTAPFEDDLFGIYLKVNPHDIITGGDEKVSEYALPDGTPVIIVSAISANGDYRTAVAYYTYNDVLYRLALSGDDAAELLDRAKAILDTAAGR